MHTLIAGPITFQTSFFLFIFFFFFFFTQVGGNEINFEVKAYIWFLKKKKAYISIYGAVFNLSLPKWLIYTRSLLSSTYQFRFTKVFELLVPTTMANHREGPAIGIDLGTTYSCVAVWQNERVEIIANDQGNRTTPSFVAFTPAERLVGDAAKNQVARNATNSVFGNLSTMNSPLSPFYKIGE